MEEARRKEASLVCSGETWARYRGDAGEMWARYGGEIGEVYLGGGAEEES